MLHVFVLCYSREQTMDFLGNGSASGFYRKRKKDIGIDLPDVTRHTAVDTLAEVAPHALAPHALANKTNKTGCAERRL